MDILVKTINESLGDLQSQFHAIALREYEDKKSAGISIVRNGTDDKVITMDISMKPVIGSRLY